MNFAQLLDYGPRLQANHVEHIEQKPKEVKRYSCRMVERYKKYSVNGIIASPMVARNESVLVGNAAKNLRQMCNDGLLKEIGRYKESKGPVKPFLYQWL